MSEPTSIYLLNHSVGLPPVGVERAVDAAFFAPWRAGETDTWPQWMRAIDRFLGGLAALLNADVADLCPQTNLSSALTKVLASLPPVPGRETVLFSEDDFPSMGFVLQAAERLGYRPRILPASEADVEPETWARHLTDDVGWVFLTHVHSNTSRRIPVAEVAAAARARGVRTIVDVAQSAGIVPIDVRAWGADFVIGSCVKWLRGGPGAGFLWVNPEIVAACAPLDVGWFSHADPFAMRIREFSYHPRALRFWGGTPSVLPAAVAAVGVEAILAAGVSAAQAHNRTLTQALIDGVPASAVRSPRSPDARGGTVVLHFGDAQADVLDRLRSAGVRFDVRSTGARLSPHLDNTAAEIERTLAAIAR